VVAAELIFNFFQGDIFSNETVKDAVRAALTDIGAAEREGIFVRVREYPLKGRTAWRMNLPGGKSVFVKLDELGRSGKWYHRFYLLHPFAQEARMLVRLRGAYLKVPQPLLTAYEPGRFFPRKVFLVTEALDDYEPLGVTINRHGDNASDIPKELSDDLPIVLAQFLAKLHKMGFFHRGLQGDHMLWRMDSAGIQWAMVDLEGAFLRRPFPMWYRIKSLYMIGRHLLANYLPEASVNFISEYHRLSFKKDDPASFIRTVLMYAAFRQENRALSAKSDKTIMDRLRFARRHWRIPIFRLWFGF